MLTVPPHSAQRQRLTRMPSGVCREYVPCPWMRPWHLSAKGHFSGRGAFFQPSVLTYSLSVQSV